MPVADRPGHALAVAVGIETDVLAAHLEADIVGLIRIRLDTQRTVKLLGLRQIFDGIDDGSDTFSHGELLKLVAHQYRCRTRMLPGCGFDAPAGVPREPASLSHQDGFMRHYTDGTRRRNVTDG